MLKDSMNESKWKEMAMNAVSTSHNAAHSAHNLATEISETRIPGNFRANMYKDTNLYAKVSMRATRDVTFKLRKFIYLFNQEIKFFQNAKEKVIKKIDSIKKNMKVSSDTIIMKNKNPLTSQKNDGTYDLVNAELSHLRSLHAQLVSIYKFASEKLKNVHEMRQILLSVLSERSVILGLTVENGGICSRPATTGHRMVRSERCDYGMTNNVDFMSSESKKVLRDSHAALEESLKAQREFEDQMKNFNERNTSIQNAVNDGILSKINENRDLQDQLHLGIAQNRQAANRLNREHMKTRTSMKILNGPLNYTDLSVSDRLDRPIIRSLHRHPGTQVGEAQSLIQAVQFCCASEEKLREKTREQIRSKATLVTEMRRKTTSIDHDTKLIRERLRKALAN